MRSTWCAGWWCDGFPPANLCLDYDGSKIPDCTQFVDPENYIPYYHQHSSSEICNQSEQSDNMLIPPDCSRFWECGPAFEACLSECSSCFGECQDRNGQFYQANIFDERLDANLRNIQKRFISRFNSPPEGPTCVYPINYDGSCTMGGDNL